MQLEEVKPTKKQIEQHKKTTKAISKWLKKKGKEHDRIMKLSREASYYRVLGCA